MPRPKRVTFIAGLLIVAAFISTISTASQFLEPEFFYHLNAMNFEAKFRFYFGLAGFIVMVVSSIQMLKGHNWARWLYIVWTAVGSTMTLMNLGLNSTVLYGLVLHVVFIILLLTKKSNDYFATAQQ